MTALSSIGKTFRILAAVMIGWVAASGAVNADAGDAGFRLYKVQAPYDQVRQDLADAITNRGLVVDNVSHIAKMLDRTAKAVGAKRRIYDKAEALQFCSALYSRRMMEADPRNILFCPYVIVIYSTAAAPKTTIIGYRRPDSRGSSASKKALKAVDHLLDQIVREAAGVN